MLRGHLRAAAGCFSLSCLFFPDAVYHPAQIWQHEDILEIGSRLVTESRREGIASKMSPRPLRFRSDNTRRDVSNFQQGWEIVQFLHSETWKRRRGMVWGDKHLNSQKTKLYQFCRRQIVGFWINLQLIVFFIYIFFFFFSWCLLVTSPLSKPRRQTRLPPP